ncbi:MAG: hypothetical protein PUE01_06235 [Clostridiaceae bacterium]|nr:hypothetical protein [Clostridiaceae bacterium]
MPILLIIMGAILIFLNYKALKKDDKSFSNVLKYKKEDISDLELEIGRIRKDMAESLLDLQQEIIKLQENNDTKNQESLHKLNKVNKESFDNNKETMLSEKSNDNNGVINDIHVKSKTETIKELIDLGFSDDEICEKLSLGKGEVQLVKGLYKK